MKERHVQKKGDLSVEMRQVGGLSIKTCLAMIGVSGWLSLLEPSMANSQSRPMMIAGLTERGMVTEVRERTIVIDGRDYEFDQKVEVFDAEGNQADLSTIVRNAEVRFRLKQEDVNKIDRIVVYLPQ
jgi:hypothetical protein